jgi:hypothetical protein
MSDPKDPVDPFPTQAHPPVSPFPPLDPPSDWIDTADAHDLPTRKNALVALGRFAFPPAAPLDEEGEASRARRWTSQTLFVVCAFLMIFNAGSVQNWARQQPPGWGQSTVDRLATAWVEQLELLGANLPVDGMRQAWRELQAVRFDGREDEPA